jgi:hypothetical protein
LPETKSAIHKAHLREKSDLRQRSVSQGVDSRRGNGGPTPDRGKGGDDFAVLHDISMEMISGTVANGTTNGGFLRGFLKEGKTGRI